jgi:hypothetical protein
VSPAAIPPLHVGIPFGQFVHERLAIFYPAFEVAGQYAIVELQVSTTTSFKEKR